MPKMQVLFANTVHAINYGQKEIIVTPAQRALYFLVQKLDQFPLYEYAYL